MTVSALVLSLDPENAEGVVRALQRIPEVHVGALHGERLPVVVETEDAESGVEVTRQLLDTSGVLAVDVVSIDFDDDGDHEGGPASAIGSAEDAI